MSEFVFLYRRPATSWTVQQMQESMVRWQAWFKKMEQSGHLANYGQPLEPKGGRVVKDKKGGYSDGRTRRRRISSWGTRSLRRRITTKPLR